jgi:hypothetical protein
LVWETIAVVALPILIGFLVTPGAQEGVTEGYADVAAGRTISNREMKERLGIDN